MEIHTAQMFSRNELCTSIEAEYYLFYCSAYIQQARGGGGEVTLNASQKNILLQSKKNITAPR